MTKRRLADWFIRLGLWLQVVFLLFVDWGTIVGFIHAPELPWGHLIALVLVNLVLGASAVVALRWTRRAQARESAESQPALR